MTPPTKLGLAWLMCAVSGCATFSMDATAREVEGRVLRCLDIGREGEVQVVAVATRGRLQVRSTRGLAPDEEHCVRSLVGELPVPRRLTRARVRLRQRRSAAPHDALTHMLARRAAVIECRPCRRTTVVATPIGARYSLSVELLDGEPALDVGQSACIVSALAGMPSPTNDRREVVASIDDDRAECSPRRVR